MTKLNDQELQSLINIVSEVSVPIKSQKPFVELINKLSLMKDELNNEPTKK